QHDATPTPGESVFLSGGGGLPAGFYTLLPAHYATLPGAYRLALVPKSQDALASQNQVLADGTVQMAGFFADPAFGTRNARRQAFFIQSSSVWRQYSEIDQTSGSTFFAVPTQSATTVPPLPQDAGHLALDAVGSLTIAGGLLTAPAAGGRGAELDIAAL